MAVVPGPLAEFLSPEERLARIDVRAQVRECRAVLASALAGDEVPLGEINGAFNKGSLMYATVGDLAESQRSCERQIAILTAGLGDPQTRSDSVAMILRPWVNIGRLMMLRGDWRAALPYFQSVRALIDQTPFRVGDAAINAADIDFLARRSGFVALQSWAALVLVRDVTKAYCRGRAFDRLGAATGEWSMDPQLASMSWTLEARAIADTHGHGQGWSLAEQAARIRRRGLGDLTDLALTVHDGYLALVEGRAVDADDTVTECVRFARRHDAETGLDLTNCRVLIRLGELGEARGMPDHADWCFRRLLALAEQAGDEHLIVEAALALARVCPAEAQQLTERANVVLDSTLHFALRRLRPGATPLAATAVPELMELRAVELELVERRTAVLTSA